MSRSPAWLKRWRTSGYLQTAIEQLENREYSREVARDLARRRAANEELFDAENDYLAPFIQNPQVIDHYDISEGCKPENATQNRYVRLEPFDRTRVVVPGPSGGRYLHANWVQELHGGKWWIAAQAPLPFTAHTFLSLIAQPSMTPPQAPAIASRRIRTVVQLTRDVESGRRKAHRYFPSQVGQHADLTPSPIEQAAAGSAPALRVTLLDSTSIEDAHCICSKVSIAPLNTPDEIVLFHHLLYTAWPDHGVPAPEDRASLRAFLRLADAKNRETSSDRPDLDPDPPIVINCSAGIGRTGSFITMSSILRHHGILPAPSTRLDKTHIPAPLGPLPDKIANDEICQEVDALREQRPGMVQSGNQISLIYEVLDEELSSQFRA
ncbi:protein-tyrosine phosphatase-like protein [Flagelloscypha sp. PMI_526]|nr:protein-tyrosine phosphatase-like protein [Flagelloscypha sp. PMI_526]